MAQIVTLLSERLKYCVFQFDDDLECGTCAVFLCTECNAEVRTAPDIHGLSCLSSSTERKIFSGNRLVREAGGNLTSAVVSSLHLLSYRLCLCVNVSLLSLSMWQTTESHFSCLLLGTQYTKPQLRPFVSYLQDIRSKYDSYMVKVHPMYVYGGYS